MITDIKDIEELLMDVLRVGLVPMVVSDPGVGKSSIAKQIAEKNDLKLIDVRLSQCDPTDLNGFPFIKGDKASYKPMDTFPIKGDAVPEGKKGWLILLDEFNSASLSVQAAAYKLILDKQVGQYDLHESVAMIAAGNLSTSKAIVHSLSTAMQSRMVHFEVKTSKDTWKKWAIENEIDHRIVSFIDYKPDLLHSFDSSHNDFTFPCPRTWEFLSKIISKWQTIPINKVPVVAGTIGEGVGREFIGFTDIYKDLPSIEQIMDDPNNIKVVKNPSINYALTGVIAYRANESNLPRLMEFIKRLPVEFQVITIRTMMQKNKDFEMHPTVLGWISDNSHHFM